MKIYSPLTQTLLLIIFSFNFSVGQSSYDDLGSIASVNIEKNDRPTALIIKEKKARNTIDYKRIIKRNEIYYDIIDVDMSTTIDIISNTLDFSGGDNNKYSKMQLTHKQSNKTIISRKIDSDFKINLNKIVPGTYMLILSNEKGAIKSEEITIL